jgi:hypothetical protein
LKPPTFYAGGTYADQQLGMSQVVADFMNQSKDNRIAVVLSGKQMYAAAAPPQSGAANAPTGSGSEDDAKKNRWLIFWHSSDVASLNNIAAQACLLALQQIKNDGALGFYLADSPVAAEFFAVRRGVPGNPGV